LIPSSVEALGSKCFLYCFSLSSITFESNSHLIRIESEAFYESSLQSIVIPRSVRFIDGSAFIRAVTEKSDLRWVWFWKGDGKFQCSVICSSCGMESDGMKKAERTLGGAEDWGGRWVIGNEEIGGGMFGRMKKKTNSNSKLSGWCDVIWNWREGRLVYECKVAKKLEDWEVWNYGDGFG
jgi:hypothetical protein